MAITLRAAREEDLAAILHIYNDAILNSTAVYHYQAHTPEMRLDWFRQKQAEGMPVLVSAEAGAVTGFSTYGPFRAWAAYKYTAEISVYIHPEHRGKGIARLHYARLLELAQEQQLHVLVAGIDADNEASIRLHRRFGFTEAGLFRQAGYKFGRWLDLLFMQLLLPTPERPSED